MNLPARTRWPLFVYSTLGTLGILLLSTRYLFAGTLSRLALGAVLLALAGGFAYLAGRILREPSFAERLLERLAGTPARRGRSMSLALLVLLAAGIAAALPGYRVIFISGYYWQALQPIFVMLALLAAGAWIVTQLVPVQEDRAQGGALAAAIQPAALALAAILALWLLMRLTGLGLERVEDYWYGAGVPALPLQVLASLGLGWLAARWSGGRSGRGMDALFFVLSWAVTAALWAREPLRGSFFLPGPFRPTGDFYPFSDGGLFDVGGQFALIGQGLMDGQVFDRVGYMAFGAYLHALVGQDFVTVLAVQAALFAVLAGILYLLGRELGGVGLGVSLAALTALRGVNSIAAAGWIDLANPKMTLTDFPTAIGAALFTLLLVRWLKEPTAHRNRALLAGGVLGLTLLLRVHVLLLLLPAAALALIVTRFQWRRWLPGLLLLLLGMFAATTPWDLRNQSKGAPAFDLYFHSLRVVLQARYGWPSPAVIPTPTPAAQSFKVAPAITVEPDPQACVDTPCRVVNHFLHNALTSVLYLPASPVLDDLRTTVKTDLPFWLQGWRGEGVGLVSLGMVLANLALIALGLGVAWKEGRWVSLAPLAVFATYMLSNALAQTSGGRYIVPVDWVTGLYFLWGGLALLDARGAAGHLPEVPAVEEVSSTPKARARRIPDRGDIAWSLILVLLLGAAVPLSERLAAPRYVSEPGAAWMEIYGTNAELQDFLAQPGAGVWTGRMLYPRFYGIDKGETASDIPFNILPYPRMAFTLIGPGGQMGVVLPTEVVQGLFKSGVDVLVLGCYTPPAGGVQSGVIDALAVAIPGAGSFSLRAPHPELECPLRAPVCVDHETCY